MALRATATGFLLLVVLAGCNGGPGGPGPGWLERTDAPDKATLFVHGFAFNIGEAKSEAHFDEMRGAFGSLGWSESLVSVGYYGCDAEFELDVANFGDHAVHEGGLLAHDDDACRPKGHTRLTPIEHLAYHWAWAVHSKYADDERCIDVVTHSMGGLMVRYALAQVGAGQADFPSQLCVEDVVTLGTPHGGSVPSTACPGFTGTYQCSQMGAGSPFLQWLEEHAPNPQVGPGTDWTVVGSDADQVVNGTSGVQMGADHRYRYAASNGIHHAIGLDYTEATRTDYDAVISFLDAPGNWTTSEEGPWPVALAASSLVFDAPAWPTP